MPETPPVLPFLKYIGLKVDFFPFNGIDPFGGFKCQIRMKKTRLRKTGTLKSSFCSFIGTKGDKR